MKRLTLKVKYLSIDDIERYLCVDQYTVCQYCLLLRPFLPAMSYSLLPLEVSQFVVNYLDRKTLKSMRLADPRVAGYAAEALFERIDFRTDIRSWHRVENIASHPKLRHHVKTVYYHECTVDELPNEDFAKILYEHFGPELWANIREWGKRYFVHLYNQKLFKRLGLTDFLGVLNRDRFPNLRRLECLRATLHTPVNLFDAFHAHALWSRGDDVTFQRVCMELPFEELSMECARWEDLPISRRNESQAVLQPLTLRKVTLSLPIQEYALKHSHGYPVANVCITPLRNCFPAWKGVEHLSLDCREHSSPKDYIFTLAKISRTLASYHFPRLNHLALSRIFLEKFSFLRMLRTHLKTLSSLSLQGAYLVPNRGEDKFDSVIALIHEIPNCCQLERVSLSGRFENLLDEA